MKLAAEGGTLGLMWLIALLAWLLLAAPVQAQGVRLTCECPLPAGLMSTTCIGTHGLTREPFACLDDDAKCEKCLYDQPVPDFPGRFVCSHTCPVLVGADGQPHAASCQVISGLQPITCDNLCTYTDGFYGEPTTTTTLPAVAAVNEGVVFDGVSGDTLPSGAYVGAAYCVCPPIPGHRVRCAVYTRLDPRPQYLPWCEYRGLHVPGPPLPGGLAAWRPSRGQVEFCPAGQGAALRLLVFDENHADEDSQCWRP